MRQIIEIPIPIDARTIDQVPALYADVFAGQPWKEVSRCPQCQAFSSTDPAEMCPCQTSLCTGYYSEAAYPEPETKLYIEKELSRPQAEGLLTVKMEAVRLNIEELLAFGWGYQSTAEETSAEKYRTDEMREIVRDLLVRTGAFFYISEVGVKSSAQGMGRGKRLTEILATSGKKKSETVVLRTSENSPMRYIAQNMGMRAILGLQTGLRDKENEARVLFVGGAYEK